MRITDTSRTAAEERSFMAQLATLAGEQRRDLCGRCGGSATRPCGPCRRQRGRISALHNTDVALAAIAANVGLPAWRVEQILDEEHELAERVSDADLAAQTNADLLRPYLGELVDVILIGRGPDSPWQFDDPRHWNLWLRLTLELTGWTLQAAKAVLVGTHIPNEPLRRAVQRAKAVSGDEPGQMLTSELIGQMIGTTDGTHLDRLLGARPTATCHKKKSGKVYGGNINQAISRDWAEKIAAALALAPDAIPGL